MLKTKTFDGLCREILDAPLARHGFAWRDGGVYARTTADGEDTLGLDFRPSRERFCVMTSYWPQEFRIIFELHPEATTASRGYLCRPHLNMTGTSWNPRWLKAKDKESATQSLQLIVPWIENAGLAWLAALRHRQFFAVNADPVAAVPRGYAHELAGNLAAARESYREMNRRFELMNQHGGIRKCREGWRYYIFVQAKLGIANAETAEIRALAGWDPHIEPLGSG